MSHPDPTEPDDYSTHVVPPRNLDYNFHRESIHELKASQTTELLLFKANQIELNEQLEVSEIEDVFTTIYRDCLWEVGSGHGSHPDATIEYRRFLEDLLAERRPSTILDIGCGDWQSSRLVHWGASRYIGIDVVKSIVERNQRLYSTSKIEFRHQNVMTSTLPEADFVIVKDVLQHLSNGNVAILLKELSRYPGVLITNSIELAPEWGGRNVNAEIKDGAVRPLDVRQPPFNLTLSRHLMYDAQLQGKRGIDLKLASWWTPHQ